MIEIFGPPSSINVRKVIWACEELNLDYQLNADNGFIKEINPNGLAPVIRDEKFDLWESNTIIRYLADTHSNHKLFSTAPRERAIINQWIDWQATEFNNSWRYAFQALVRKNPAFDDSNAIDKSVSDWTRHIQILDAQINATGAYVAGDRFTLADIPIGLSVNRSVKSLKIEHDFPAVARYFNLLLERPIFKELSKDC